MSPRNGPLEELSRASETTAVGRSYVAEADGGAAYLRNRRYIKASTATARRNVIEAPMQWLMWTRHLSRGRRGKGSDSN